MSDYWAYWTPQRLFMAGWGIAVQEAIRRGVPLPIAMRASVADATREAMSMFGRDPSGDPGVRALWRHHQVRVFGQQRTRVNHRQQKDFIRRRRKGIPA